MRTKSIFVSVTAVLLMLLAVAVAPASASSLSLGSTAITPYTGIFRNVSIVFGQKTLKKSDWGKLDTQTEYGFQTSFQGKDWPGEITVGWLWSVGKCSDKIYDVVLGNTTARETGKTSEFSLGVKKTWNLLERRVLHPYLAVGGALVTAAIEMNAMGTRVEDSYSSLGVWEEVGAAFDVYNSISLGARVRYSYADAKLFDTEGSAGGWHYGVTLGYSF